MLRSKFFLAVFSFTLILLSAFVFQNPNNQGINWSFPYFSGAANFEQPFDWQISPIDFDVAIKLSDQEYRQYKHQKTEGTITNTVNSYGYVFVALVAQKLFPFAGDVQAVIFLQLLVHLGVCIFLLLKIYQSPLQRYGFIFLYAANPLIVYFVTFPFYYFWMFIPSAALVVLWFKPVWRQGSVLVLTPLLLLSLLIRPTTIFLCILFFAAAWILADSKRERWVVFAATVLFICGVVLIAGQSSSAPWHPMYIGVGAYENNLGVPDISDNRGYEYYRRQTGVQINTDAVRGNWNDVAVRAEYMNILKDRYFEMVKAHPVQFLRNATMNTLQIFSVGYIVDRPQLTTASTAAGFFILFFLAYARQLIWVVAVLSSSLSFAWYFPPIPAYNFAAYLLLVSGCLSAFEKVLADRFR